MDYTGVILDKFYCTYIGYNWISYINRKSLKQGQVIVKWRIVRYCFCGLPVGLWGGHVHAGGVTPQGLLSSLPHSPSRHAFCIYKTQSPQSQSLTTQLLHDIDTIQHFKAKYYNKNRFFSNYSKI